MMYGNGQGPQVISKGVFNALYLLHVSIVFPKMRHNGTLTRDSPVKNYHSNPLM